jgi:hypothetical protein
MTLRDLRDLLDPLRLPAWFWYCYASTFTTGLVIAWAQ